MKYLLSLMLVTAMTCIEVYSSFAHNVKRCENSEAICYIYYAGNRGGISCKFKEQEQ